MKGKKMEYLFNRPKSLIKIKGDAGTYEIWGIDWLNRKVLIYRANEYEWVDLKKITSRWMPESHVDKSGKFMEIGGQQVHVGTD